MKLVYSHDNHFIVGNIKNLIEAQGIQTFIKNEFTQGAMGETSAVDSWPEIWVFDDNDHQQALAIAMQSQQSADTPDWVCNSCNESNDGSFDFCWQCQQAK
ncbi:DUF2007 domain-containing protein [Psychromonas sp. 14N.309.X.WAT.B.A12]|uniref:putative signal transducing protein n=1 Tax=unclassified Psychromonas TaxID=2614957 RepID=UPI0025B0E12C|nr:DUF2007 domain-containing protein [Psychromonas sp. 14N.309.X.WAT.B.A12]MDN2662403.1 DUF2007 domain-containing protein [Psychromonas sp. 14N.309.X.WAT.B.A12]